LQSSTAGNNGAPTSVPLSLGHALYLPSRTASNWRSSAFTERQTLTPPVSFKGLRRKPLVFLKICFVKGLVFRKANFLNMVGFSKVDVSKAIFKLNAF
jgi:hypothetical protein